MKQSSLIHRKVLFEYGDSNTQLKQRSSENGQYSIWSNQEIKDQGHSRISNCANQARYAELIKEL
jgi:hypothetical protein